MTWADDALEPEVPARPPSLLGALRQGAGDFFYNSWRVVPVNVIWGLWFLVVLFAWASVNLILAIVLVPPLAVPLAGLARFGGLATRGEALHLPDALDPIRRRPVAVIAGGVGFALGLLVLGSNVVSGFAMADFVGVALATTAAWGLVALFGFALAFWPLLADPARDAVPARAIARLAGLLLLAHPFRILLLAVIVGALLLVSAALFAALLTVSVAFAMLVAARYVLPAADRLEARLGLRAGAEDAGA